MRKFFSRFVIISFLSLMLAACGGAVQDIAPATSLSVEMSEFKFSPASMLVVAGQEITLDLRNDGAIEHEFTILKKGVTAQIPFDREKQAADILVEYTLGANKNAQFKFTLPDAGEYQVICGIQGHMEAGMVATLTAK